MIKAYVINLDRNQERIQALKARFDNLALTFERFPAVDGKNITDAQLKEFADARPAVSVLGKWTKGKMGCHMSHRTLWKLAAESQHRYTAIFEDDVIISDSLQNYLMDDTWIPADADIIRLESPAFMRILLSKKEYYAAFNRMIIKILPNQFRNAFPMGAGAYIIERDAAKRLLAAPLEGFIYTDRSLFDHSISPVARILTTYQLVPSCCIQDKFFHENPENIKFHSEIETSDNADLYSVKRNGLVKLIRYVAENLGAINAYKYVRDIVYAIKGYRRVPYKS